MKTLKLSIILAVSLLTGYTYAASTEQNDSEAYVFETEMNNEFVNLTARKTTEIGDASDLYGVGTKSNYREEYVFGMETFFTNKQTDLTVSSIEWNDLIDNDEFSFK